MRKKIEAKNKMFYNKYFLNLNNQNTSENNMQGKNI